MPKFNLYKIIPEKKDDLVEKLQTVGLVRTAQKVIDEYTMEFYFSEEPDEIEIWWVDLYKDYLDSNRATPFNLVFFGTMIIFSDHVCYAVSLGKSHFYLKNFCDRDFGLQLAERIIDQNNLKIKNSKFFKSKKSKAITSFQANTSISYDSGESFHYIKAKTIDKDVWGKVASFGSSALLSLDVAPEQLINVIDRIEAKLREQPAFILPKADLINDETEEEILDNKLGEALEASADSEIQVDEFSVSGVDFIFADRDTYQFFVAGDASNKSDPVDLSVDNLVSFSRSRGLNLATNINDIKVYINNEHGRGHSVPVKEFLDYIDNDRYCLIDGKWHRFNDSYIQYLQNEVDRILWVYDAGFDVPLGTIEDTFNEDKEQNQGYINIHKNFSPLDDPLAKKYKVEKMDLYKDGELLFVKIGNPQSLGYVVDQALNTVRLLQNNSTYIKLENEAVEVSTICLWIILDRARNIQRLSTLNSIIFLMKLVEWRKVVIDAGFTPLIRVNYRRN